MIDGSDPRPSSPCYRVQEEVSLRGSAIEWLAPGQALVSKRNVLHQSEAIGGDFRRIGAVPLSMWRCLGNRVRLAQRALRLMFYNALPMDDGSVFVTYAREVGIVRNGIYRRLAVSALFTKDGIWYATDAEFETNRVFRIDRATGRRFELGMVDGPVYYSTRWRRGLFFAVTAELCPSQTGRSATLWAVRDGELSRVVSVEKDRWPVKLLPGTLHFPGGPGVEQGLYFQAVALKGVDARCFRVEARRETPVRSSPDSPW